MSVDEATLHPRAAELIALLDLRAHPEGGFYREVFRSARQVTGGAAAGPRTAATAIEFLLVGGSPSRWHRVASDEIWTHVEGDPVEHFHLEDGGTRLVRTVLGSPGSERRPVHAVPAGCWQAARPMGPFALVSCVVAPGFEFGDLAMLASRATEAAAVRSRFPELAELI